MMHDISGKKIIFHQCSDLTEDSRHPKPTKSVPLFPLYCVHSNMSWASIQGGQTKWFHLQILVKFICDMAFQDYIVIVFLRKYG